MCKFCRVLISLVLILAVFSVSSFAKETEYGWFFRRNKHEPPEITDGERLIAKYGGVCVDRKCEDKVIYLTFDVGYENGNVAKILDTLKKEGVSAAFFILDNIIYKNIDLVNRMANEGHLVCNHTKKHRNICNFTKDEIAAELGALETLYTERTGREMSKYFRFPEGKYTVDAVRTVNELGYKSIFWSFGYEDWDNSKQPSEDYAIKKILSNTHNGAVILLHPTSATNAAIMRTLIREWRNMGYSFGTLDELTAET